MKLHQESSDILSGGLMDETEFSMDESSLHIVFDILRNKVYKDPISSICREVASNSRDAQREASDFKTAIEIEISDKRNSMWVEDGLNIIFRDFGIGLSPDRVKNIYSKYGASTKRDTNTMTGGFGLGAKTPFSYTDSFTVRAVYENIEYHYQIYIDETKKGKIALINEAAFPNNGNITEIIIPLKSTADLEKFKIAVLKNTYFWPIRPKLINFDDFGYDKYNYQVTSIHKIVNNYEVVHTNNVVHSSLNAIIDGIYYPVDTNILKEFKNDHAIGFLLYFDNGELTVSANRESLQYDSKTIKIITDKMNSVLENLKTDIQSKVDKTQCLYSAIQYLQKIKLDSKLNTFLVTTTNFIYNGKTLPKQYPTISLKGINVHFYSVTPMGISRLKVTDLFSNEFNLCINDIYFSDAKPFKSDNQRSNTLKKNKRWILITKTNPELLNDKQKEEHKNHIDDSFKKLADYGINVKLYDDVVRTPNEKKDRKPRVKKPVELFRKVTFREKSGYDGYRSYEFVVDKATGAIAKEIYSAKTGTITLLPAKVVFFQENEKRPVAPSTSVLSNDRYDDLLSDLHNIANGNSHRNKAEYYHFVRIPESKEKFITGAQQVFQFIVDPQNLSIFNDVVLRDKLKKVEKHIDNLISYKFGKSIDDKIEEYDNLINRIPHRNYYSLFSLLNSHITINTDDPSIIIKQIEEMYPLVNGFSAKDYIHDYIKLVNENNAMKEEIKNLKNII